MTCSRAPRYTAELVGTGLVALLVISLVPLPAEAQIQVTPQRPTQSNVQYFDFDWRHKDIRVGEKAEDASLPPATIADRWAGVFSSPVFGNQTPEHHHHPGRPGHHGVPDYRSTSPPTNRQSFPEPEDEGPTRPPPPSLEEDRDQEPEATDVFESTDLGDRAGGVRLYFYERERSIAERAAAYIEESYRNLVDLFNFVPEQTLPYILYNSYQEFLQTNIFPVQEGVLGVTGRAEAQLVLPYFGDHRRFQHISSHEMVHQFQIQKARHIASSAEVSGDPMDRMPLWFIEGIAEYYSLEGLDDEAEMLTRDLLLNPDPEAGLVMLDFFEDRPRSQLWTYKIGQARVAFLEDVYGTGTIQKVFNRSYRLIGSRREGRSAQSFESLLVDITGDSERQISDKFEAWVKRRSYASYLDSRQDAPDIRFYDDIRGVLQTMTTSPNGQLVMYRSIQRATGQVRLHLADARNTDVQERVTGDGQPGVESLDPVGARNFDLQNGKLAFIARAEGRDVLYLQDIDHEFGDEAGESREASIDIGDRTGYNLGEHGLLAAESPAFSPDGRRVAFIGLDEEGQKDIFIFEPLQGDDALVTRVTDSPQAERGLSWGQNRLVFTSDATGHGKYNLFTINLAEGSGEPKRLTFEERDHIDPRIFDGRIFFSAYTESRSNLFEWTEDGPVQRTDVVTGLFDASPGPDGDLWASYQHGGQRRIVRMPSQNLLDEPTDGDGDDPGEVHDYPSLSLDDSEPYRVTDIENWQLSNLFGVLGASGGGIFGQLMLLTNDRLRNHALFVNVLALGDLDNTVADILYLNQADRLIWGAGLFQDVSYRLDRQLQQEVRDLTGEDRRLLTGERFYGARGTLRYPLNRFAFIQGDLAVGGVTAFMLGSTENALGQIGERYGAVDDARQEFIDPWQNEHDDHHFQTSPSLSLGYNTLRYHPRTGPIDGTSALLKGTLDHRLFTGETHGKARLDVERYLPIYDRINLSLRLGLGSTFGGPLARQFLLSSFDTLRGVDYNNFDYLLGNQFLFSKLELRFPLNFIVRVPLIDIEGIVGADFGGAGQTPADAWRSRSFAPVTGFNFGLGPLVFRLHFARPVDIGAQYALPRGGDWITNFSLGWRYW